MLFWELGILCFKKKKGSHDSEADFLILEDKQ